MIRGLSITTILLLLAQPSCTSPASRSKSSEVIELDLRERVFIYERKPNSSCDSAVASYLEDTIQKGANIRVAVDESSDALFYFADYERNFDLLVLLPEDAPNLGPKHPFQTSYCNHKKRRYKMNRFFELEKI